MSYILKNKQTIHMPKKSENAVIGELLSNYTYGAKWDIAFDTDENCIRIGDAIEKHIDNNEYVLNITDAGIYIGGIDRSAVMRGFVAMLEKIKYEPENDSFYIENCTEYGKPHMKFRCAHLCIFPETKLDFLKKCVRSCAIVKYSHIILEFWGMLKYDCMKELAWPFAYSKDEIKEIVKEANALGVEIIPMFNHLGHASACREKNGKHVVLDQNPKYEYMFNACGWIWNSKRADVRELLSKIRDELIEVCGEGKYFHIGCDEAYSIGSDKDAAIEMARYLNEVACDLESKGRRTIIWHDMLISRQEFPGYVANSVSEISEILMNSLDKNMIIADWQYSVHNENWPTSKKFKDYGFDTVCCPWDNNANINEAIKTADDNELFGIIHTTWHTLYRGFDKMIYAGALAYNNDNKNASRHYSARVARMALPAQGDYEKCGWSEKMVGPGLV